ncbi:ATP-binding protein [Simiduia aestuariiviva]|uniref:histidine kinase n=1 Tax=Simiduia aestuariiviva TaxID=1510459 RepID=A0A839UMM9_9GAMM|nr:signal transduction histidine kinase [Simiduia aestuariiviva]
MNFKRWAMYGGGDPSHLSPVEARQYRLWRYCQWLMLLVIGVFAVMAYRQQIAPRMLGLSIAWCCCLVAVIVCQPQYRTWSIVGTMIGTTLAAIVGCATNGGLGSMASAWIVYLPLLGGVMGGSRIAKIWVYVSGLMILVFLLLDINGMPMPNLTPPEFAYRQDVIQLCMQVIAVAMMLNGLIGQVELSELAMSKTIDTLNDEVASRLFAEQKAVQAEKKKAEFFTSMSHELKTPLNAITGFTRMAIKQAKNGRIDERGLDALQRVLSNGQDLLSLVKNLLVISKSSKGEVEENKLDFDLVHLVSEVVSDLSSLVSDRVALINHCSGSMKVHACMPVLRRILINLVGNALKYTDEGTVTVSVQNAPAKGKTWLAISVSDTGPGIPDEELPFLFEPYTRGVANNHKAGTGLGLALSQQWARQLGGYIDLTTQKGTGSEFTLYLPRELLEPDH